MKYSLIAALLAFLVIPLGIVLFLSRPPATTPVPNDGTNATSTEAAYKSAMTTYFWVGEPADESNDFIQNSMSYWDEEWLEHFGGPDNPDSRCGYAPCGVTPKENAFYVALPYAEFDEGGDLKESRKSIPWYTPSLDPLLKNHWVEVKHGDKICYGQWEDVGPNNEDDFAYVFGSSTSPTNTFGVHAGLDVSPSLFDCLGMLDNDTTLWRFVDASLVPDGPWKATVTSSGISWE